MNLFKTLIIEDSLVFRQTFKKVLGTKFPAMEIAEAADGKEALEKLTSFQPRLIFLDVKLPDGNGLEFTRKIKAQDPSVMILILTSYDIPEHPRGRSPKRSPELFCERTHPQRRHLGGSGEHSERLWTLKNSFFQSCGKGTGGEGIFRS